MDQKTLTQTFGEFAGKTLKNPQRMTCDIDDVLWNLEAKAKENGLSLRVLWNGPAIDDSHDPKRLSVNVTEENGKYKIRPDFYLG